MGSKIIIRFGADEENNYLIEHKGKQHTISDLITMQVAEYVWRKGKVVGVIINETFNGLKLIEQGIKNGR